MVSTKQAVDAVWRHIGLDPPRVGAVAKKLTENGIIPSGGPGRSPQLDVEHVLSLIIGCSLDAPLRAVADCVRQYLTMPPAGANLDGAPDRIPRTAGDALEIWCDIAIHGGSDLLRRDVITVVATWPEIVIRDGDKAHRFVPIGEVATHWRERGHRKAVEISGAALVDCVRALFTEKK
jgi:hypothetical protein